MSDQWDQKILDAAARLIREGRHREAIDALKGHLRHNQADARAELLLADAFGKLGDAPAAVEHATRSAALEPANPQAHTVRAAYLLETGQHEAALEAFAEALRLAPDRAGSWTNLAMTLFSLGRAGASIGAFEKAISLAPADLALRAQLAKAHQETGNFDTAIRIFRAVIGQAPENLAYRLALADTYRLSGNSKAGIGLLQQTIEDLGDSAKLQEILGYLYITTGDFDSAGRHYRRALSLAPGQVNALLGLSRLEGRASGDALCRDIEAKLADPRLPEDDRISLLFALGMALDRRGRYDEAIRMFTEGNRRKRSRLPYDLEAESARFESIKRTFADIAPLQPRDLAHLRPIPIFIIGMPRSGTTLVEQILGSHAEVHACGELPFIRRLIQDWPDGPGQGKPYPHRLGEMEGESLDELGEAYLRKVRQLSSERTWAIDKMPYNFEYLGLISRILPQSRIIHCRRDPMDTCVSNYTTLFNGDAMAFSYDLRGLAGYHALYDDLMAHWARTLELPILELRYEALVEHQETESRRLLDFCGLTWDERVLRFHEHKRPVLTASSTQVRQPLYRTGVGRWRRFGGALNPLEKLLSD